MEVYEKELAPWETKRGYYQNIKLGADINSQKETLKIQTLEMIKSKLASGSSIIASNEISDDSINSLGYSTESIARGMFGMGAAFEWGITDVVWQLEMERGALKDILDDIYMGVDTTIKADRIQAVAAYGKGDINFALERFLELTEKNKSDFAIHISLGIIYLMEEVDKEAALNYFDRAVYSAKNFSKYHTSYALLHKALIKRDLGNVEEAESSSDEAVKLSPDFIEAIYQNALYNALLDKPDKAVPLLKKAIDSDIVYCLKIGKEKGFDGIRSKITEMFSEIRDEENTKVESKLKKREENVDLLKNIIKNIQKQGHKVSKAVQIGSLQELNSEVAKMIGKKSIIEARAANVPLSQMDNMLKLKIQAIKSTFEKLQRELNAKIEESSSELVGKKDKGGLKQLFIYLVGGQVVIVPIGFSMGTPMAIYIGEGVLFFLYFYWKVILPRSGWGDILRVQEKKEKLEQLMGKLNKIE